MIIKPEVKCTLKNMGMFFALIVYVVGTITGTIASFIYDNATGVLAMGAFAFGIPAAVKLFKEFKSCI